MPGQELGFVGCQPAAWSELASYCYTGASLSLNATAAVPLQRCRSGIDKTLHRIYETSHKVCAAIFAVAEHIDSHLLLHLKCIKDSAILSLAQLFQGYSSLLVLRASLE